MNTQESLEKRVEELRGELAGIRLVLTGILVAVFLSCILLVGIIIYRTVIG